MGVVQTTPPRLIQSASHSLDVPTAEEMMTGGCVAENCGLAFRAVVDRFDAEQLTGGGGNIGYSESAPGW